MIKAGNQSKRRGNRKLLQHPDEEMAATKREGEDVLLLREILKWVRFAGMKEVKSTLETFLDTPEKRLAYQLSDGEHTREQVQALSGIKGGQTMTDLWLSWTNNGLGDRIEIRKGSRRFRRSFSLDDFGINYPHPIGEVKAQEPVEGQNVQGMVAGNE